MKLIDALRIAQQQQPEGSQAIRMWLCCSFTPLHLLTYTKAHLRLRYPDRPVHVKTGLFGDLGGTLEKAARDEGATVLAVVEWADADPRLGARQLGGWLPSQLAEIREEAAARIGEIARLLLSAAGGATVVVSLPSLPLPPVCFTRAGEWSWFEVELEKLRVEAAAELAAAGICLVRDGETASRHDLRAELQSGFPYQLAYADRLAELLVAAAAPREPRKGLITDLDDTLWKGILGDDGVEAVAWDLEHAAQGHGLYQQVLGSLAETGVLLGIASKNQRELVDQALRRSDLHVRGKDFYPVEVSWGPKSESVARILRAWNIGADAVMFVDDSAMEIEEVSRAYPGMQCVLFPKNDPEGLWRLLWRMREEFGKRGVREEDRLRSASLRNAAGMQEASRQGTGLEDLLRGAEGRLQFSWGGEAADARALELINKTNQFNLNGRRLSAQDWQALLKSDGGGVLAVRYRDKFGALGKIAVVTGRWVENRWRVESWVMSCRAFSRRIEYHTLVEIFERSGAGEIELDYTATERNGPLGEFFAALTGGQPDGAFRLTRNQLEAQCPPLYHQVEAWSRAEA